MNINIKKIAQALKAEFSITSICVLLFLANFYLVRISSIFDMDIFLISYISYSFYFFAIINCILEVISKEKTSRMGLLFQVIISFCLMLAFFTYGKGKLCCALVFYYHIALNIIFPVIIFIRIFLCSSSKNSYLIPKILMICLFCIFIYDFIICRNQKNCIDKTVDCTKVDDLQVYDVDSKLQSEFYNWIRTKEIYAIIGFADTLSEKHLLSQKDIEFVIPKKVKDQIRLLETSALFFEIVKRYETMDIDVGKYLSFSEFFYDYDDVFSYGGDDIRCIASYYLICFFNDIKGEHYAKSFEYYKKIGKWKNIALIRCPSNGSSKDYQLYSYIVNLELHMLCVMKRHYEHYLRAGLNINDELAKLKNDCLFHYQLSREKLAFLYLIKCCNCISLSKKLFADEKLMQRIFAVQREKMGALKREKMTFTSLLYHEWDESGLLDWNLIIRNPIFKFWSKMINQRALIKAISNNEYSLMDSSVLKGCYAYFLCQCAKSNEELHKNLETIDFLQDRAQFPEVDNGCDAQK